MQTLTDERKDIYRGTRKLVITPSEKIFGPPNEVFAREVYFDGFGGAAYSIPGARVIIWVRRFISQWIISPLFLLGSLIIYTCVPSKVLNKGIKPALLNGLNKCLKRLLDILGAAIGLLLCSVIFLILPLLIKLDSEGPVFYTQLRVGQNRRKNRRRRIPADTYAERRNGDRRKNNLYGKPFVIYKFRTMRDDAERKCGPVWASKNDPRVTPLGKILRATHIDEIPQLINILKGDMSFVGPRPERPYFVTQLAAQVPRYIERLDVKPGLTGLAQVNCGYDYSIESVKTKLNYDLHYCKNGNLYSYVKILLVTIIKAIVGKIKF